MATDGCLNQNNIVFQNTGTTLVQATATANTLTLTGNSADVALNGLASTQYNGSTSGTITIDAPAVVPSFTLTLPAADGSSGQPLVTDGAGNLSFSGGSAPPDVTTVTSSTYTILDTDEIINVDTATIAAASTITLPAIGTVGQKIYTITDSSGSAELYNITVDTTGADTILGDTEVVLIADRTSITVYNDTTSAWFVK